jgi:hypothetical protein
MVVFDNFLSTPVIDADNGKILSAGTYTQLKQHSKVAEFKDIENAADGVIYPLICDDIPEEVRNDTLWMLGSVIHRKPRDVTMFMRMSPKGVECPHIFHNDSSMGKYSMMLYLENNESAGTGMAVHRATRHVRPDNEYIDTYIKDQNNTEKWEVYEQSTMKENRAVIFESSLFHCALPVGGYGQNQSDSRIVFTCFFS